MMYSPIKSRALDWGYSDGNQWHGTPCQRVEYKGLVILAVQDESPENPFESWDTEPPTVVYSGRELSDYSDGDALDPLRGTSDGWLTRNQKALAKALGLDWAAWHAEALEAQDKGCKLVDLKRDSLEETLSDMAPGRGGNASDYLDAVAAVWALRNVAAESWYSTGYSQGDWANGLSVATPAWAEKVGAPRDSHAAQCKAAGKLWGAWAWGDCYGYVIAAPPGATVRQWNETGTGFDLEEVELSDLETLDSCWGYYGSEHDESGLEGAALDAAESILASAARRRLAKLGELIRARVPLHLRPALLAQASALEGSLS